MKKTVRVFTFLVIGLVLGSGFLNCAGGGGGSQDGESDDSQASVESGLIGSWKAANGGILNITPSGDISFSSSATCSTSEDYWNPILHRWGKKIVHYACRCDWSGFDVRLEPLDVAGTYKFTFELLRPADIKGISEYCLHPRTTRWDTELSILADGCIAFNYPLSGTYCR